MGNKTGIHTRKVKWRQGLGAFADPQVWLLCVFSFSFAFSNVAIGRWALSPLSILLTDVVTPVQWGCVWLTCVVDV
jgi:hypothetical protein